jgi:hypothetical protein
MFFKEAVAICYDSRAKFITALCDGGEELLNICRGDINVLICGL